MAKKIQPPKPGSNPWQTLGSQTVFKDAAFEIVRDDVIQPDGARGTYSYLIGSPIVVIVARNARGEVALVEQWRYVHHRRTLETPAGHMDERDAGLLDAAQRELREETGVSAKSWLPLGEAFAAHSRIRWHYFLAQDLQVGTPEPDGTEDISVCWLPLEVALTKLDTGEIANFSSTISLLRADRYLRRMDEI